MSDKPMEEDDVQRRVGTVVRDKWTLVRLLGTGGMAAVYVGVHRIGRRDALKILHSEAAKSKEICLRFERALGLVVHGGLLGSTTAGRARWFPSQRCCRRSSMDCF